MKTSSKRVCRQLSGLLYSYGVREIIISPGTRNAPLVMALARIGKYTMRHCIDERSAAFQALGAAVASERPVAIVCTSGSAMLNYAPAIAEAFYSRVPLIAITADRPIQWIDQRDSQTIRQYGALDAIVRKSIDLTDPCEPLFANRLINDALQAATAPLAGPVHINVQLDAPLCTEDEITESEWHKIDIFRPEPSPDSIRRWITNNINPTAKIMLAVGGLLPHQADALRPIISALHTSGVVIAAEVQSSIGTYSLDTLAENINSSLYPDIVITIGGSLVSAKMKALLRRIDKLSHITVGYDDNIVDTFHAATARIECQPEVFLPILAQHISSSYAAEIDSIMSSQAAPSALAQAISRAVIRHSAALHISNGMSIRTLQGINTGNNPVWSNRGVSGIDGTTSTAIGAARACPDKALLFVTGDMSCAYDINALAAENIGDNFTMIVIDNGGGDIFRQIQNTRHLPECEPYLAAMTPMPLEKLADAYGFDYKCVNADNLTDADFDNSLSDNNKSILHITTPKTKTNNI